MRNLNLKTCLKIGVALLVACFLFLAKLERCVTSLDGCVKVREVMASQADVTIEDIEKRENCMTMLSEMEERHRTEVSALKQQISELKLELTKYVDTVQTLDEPANDNVKKLFVKSVSKNTLMPEEAEIIALIRENTAKVNIQKQVKDEADVHPYKSLNSKFVFSREGNLYSKPAWRPRSDSKEDLIEAVFFAVDILNKKKSSTHKFAVENFVDGIYKTDQTLGTYYNLVFLSPKENYYYTVQLARPFAPLRKIKSQIIETSHILINMIIPLKGRLDKFRSFIERFKKICVESKMEVFLTVVYFGTEGLNELHGILSSLTAELAFTRFKLIALGGEFSRAKGLEEGVRSWDGPNVLLFFCDVDIAFNREFLEHCRYYTIPGKTVYYPIVFSLYNPEIVYSMQRIPSVEEQLTIDKEHGFWRDFGYGMTCQYRSDYKAIGGFEMNIHGWGFEDVQLYRKYLQSHLKVIRVPDPGIFHLYHEKECKSTLSPEQYRMCIGSKALGEASHAQLGRLAFKEEVNMTLYYMGQGKQLNHDKGKDGHGK